jgi:hypothetical protein
LKTNNDINLRKDKRQKKKEKIRTKGREEKKKG